MASTAADIMMDILIDWGVDVIFGFPGDGINGIMEALRNRQDKIRFVQVRHEEAAAFMACGYAKYTGKLGVCLATSGPGGIHLLNGLYDAKMDGQPVLAITGHHFHDLIGTHAQQDVDLDRVFMDVALYSERIMGPEHVSNATHMACRTAISRRGVAHLCFPADTQSITSQQRSERNIPHHNQVALGHRSGLPCEEELVQAAELLNRGKRVTLFVGQGALHAGYEVEQIAELLGAPVVKALLGKAVIPDDSPYSVGGIGLLGTKPGQEAIENCDTLFLIGTSFPYIEFYPKPGAVKAIQLDRDPTRIGLRYPVQVGMVGDSQKTLQKLIPFLHRKEDRSFLGSAQRDMSDWWGQMREQGSEMSRPMKPQVVAWQLGQRLSEHAIVSCDSGTITTWFARQIPVRRGQMHSLSGTLASMANGLPYAIAAQVAYPDRQCVAFVGDGGFSMLMAEFATAVKYKLPIKVVVIKNNTLGQIKWEQMVFLGNPEYGCDLQPIDFVGCAQACGGVGMRIEDPSECGAILDAALSTNAPVLIEAVVDPFTAPLPPKISAKQAVHFAESLARGEPNALKIALTATSDKVREMI